MPTPEDKARENIDRLLTQAGWAVRNQSDTNILAYRGVPIRNFTLKPGLRFADYPLYVDGRAVGVVEKFAEDDSNGENILKIAREADKEMRGGSLWDTSD
jgi:type I restriction enzyme, R subunit